MDFRLIAVPLFLIALPVHASDLTGKPRIIDGDTIEVAGQRTRLYGIDAPEMKQTCRTQSGKEQKCGVLSKQFLSDLLRNLEVTCKGKEKDHYGRLIAVCFIDWMDINEQIVMEGWALAYRKYSEDYVRAENYAKAMHRGIWRTEFIPPWEWRKGMLKR